jgi:hypothetical protein
VNRRTNAIASATSLPVVVDGQRKLELDIRAELVHFALANGLISSG